jgi:hypothetical protein
MVVGFAGANLVFAPWGSRGSPRGQIPNCAMQSGLQHFSMPNAAGMAKDD